jgi:GH25 family lysozyme M1 (1,4-beta-N-acetylmuramidase)
MTNRLCPFGLRGIVAVAMTAFVALWSAPVTGQIFTPPEQDIWTTSVYSYAPGGAGPGGGLADDVLKVGGWGDLYYSLLQFDLTGLPKAATNVKLRLYNLSANGGTPTALYLYRITQYWNWITQGTGRDHDRLWWADQPTAIPLSSTPLPAPTVGDYYYIDITDLYNGWQSGTIPNYGLELRPASSNNNFDFFASSRKSQADWQPALIIEPLAVAPVITTNPSNQTIHIGDTVAFNAAASGTPTPTVQWQLSTDGGTTFSDIPGVILPTYSFIASSADDGHQYRAVFANSAGATPTTPATLKVLEVWINSVSPNPVPGSNARQPFTIYGQNFVTGADVTLWDLTTGELPFHPLRSRRPVLFSSTQIQLSVDFTTAPHNWAVEVTNPNGKSTGAYQFRVGAPSGPILAVDPIHLPLPAAAGTASIGISNIGTGTLQYKASVKTGSSWLSITGSDAGINGGTVNITYSANKGQERWGTIEVAGKDFNTPGSVAAASPATVFVTQPGSILYGVDVSQNTTVTNWGAVQASLRAQASPKSFAFIKASSGVLTSYAEMLNDHVKNIKNYAPQLLVGSYHFAYPNFTDQNTAEAEADAFVASAGDYIGPGYLPPVLDIEDDKDLGSYPSSLGSDGLLAWIEAWIKEVRKKKKDESITPIIYTTGGYANFLKAATNSKRLATFPLWIATYPSFPDSDPATQLQSDHNPAILGPWGTEWTFQQYRSDCATQKTNEKTPPKTCNTAVEPYVEGSSPGINGPADLDSFNGDLNALRALARINQ